MRSGEEGKKKKKKTQYYYYYYFFFFLRVAQAKMKEKEIDDMIYEMSKPLARYKDDKDLDKMLRDTERSGDPMLAFIKKRKVTTGRKKPGKQRKKIPERQGRYFIREANVEGSLSS